MSTGHRTRPRLWMVLQERVRIGVLTLGAIIIVLYVCGIFEFIKTPIVHTSMTSARISNLRSRQRGPLTLGSPSNVEPRHQGIFIHIGKTGGSSARCVLHRRFREEYCKNRAVFVARNDIAVAKNVLQEAVTRVCHMAYCQKSAYSNVALIAVPYDFIVISTRNPIERIRSWWGYERDSAMKRFGTLNGTIFGCYRTLNELAMEALNHKAQLRTSRKTPETGNMNCITLAQRCIWGVQVCHRGHNFYNFEHYLAPLLNEKLDGFSDALGNPLVAYVVRNEYKWYDLEKINILLGGGSYSFSHEGQEIALRAKPHDFLSDTALTRICRSLCEEIWLYLFCLTKAPNLTPSDILVSLDDVQQSCGNKLVDICPRTKDLILSVTNTTLPGG